MSKKGDSKKAKKKVPVKGKNPDGWKVLPDDLSEEELLAEIERERRQEIQDNPSGSMEEAEKRQRKFDKKKDAAKNKGRTKKQRSDIAAIVRVCYSMELSPEDIIEMVEEEYDVTLSISDVAQYINRVVNEIKADVESKDAGVVYSRYIMGQLSILRDLNGVIKNNKDNGKYANAVVGALRLKMDINEKILKTGQEMGFISKLPEGHYILNGKDLRNSSTDELIEKIAEEDAETRELVKELLKSTGLTKRQVGNPDNVFFLTPQTKKARDLASKKEIKAGSTEG